MNDIRFFILIIGMAVWVTYIVIILREIRNDLKKVHEARDILQAVEKQEKKCDDCFAKQACHSGMNGTAKEIDFIKTCAMVLHDDIRRSRRVET